MLARLPGPGPTLRLSAGLASSSPLVDKKAKPQRDEVAAPEITTEPAFKSGRRALLCSYPLLGREHHPTDICRLPVGTQDTAGTCTLL